jgi:hypothetical protein
MITLGLAHGSMASHPLSVSLTISTGCILNMIPDSRMEVPASVAHHANAAAAVFRYRNLKGAE